jgi:hypothetical protein
MNEPWRSEGDGIDVSRLRNEFRESERDMEVRLTPEQESEVVLDEVYDALGIDSFQFDESVVKANLPELLLLLVAHRQHGSHGKGLMGDLGTLFDTRLSPGTVYPTLHELEESGLLQVQELVRTKEYRIEDHDRLHEHIAAAMEQHMVLGLFFKTALSRLEEQR